MGKREVKAVSEICKNCRFWKFTPDTESRDEYGSCLRHPPTVIILEDQAVSIRPVSEWRDHCGEFQTRFDA